MKKLSDEIPHILQDAPYPELAYKILTAAYILSKGKEGNIVSRQDIEYLVKNMTLDELKINAKRIMESKK